MFKKDAVIFDLNNTLRKESGKPRQHILKKAKKAQEKEQVVVVSGETNKDYGDARSWLDSHGLDDARLDMRPKSEHPHDEEEKAHLLTHNITRQFNVKKAYDDKASNVKMFKNHGIKAKEV